MLKFNATTPLQFYEKKSTYVPGQGHTTTWTLIASGQVNVFYCEWRSAFGDRLTSAQALGVGDSATVRTFYNPTLYEKLRNKQVIIAKNADKGTVINGVVNKDNPNTYELWSGVDNVAEERQFMEFTVRRYEGT